jgi:hypothetical protein
MITPYIDALLQFFGRIHWLGQRVPVVYAGPDRAHAQMIQYWAKRQASTTGKSVDEIRKQYNEANIPRPFISVTMEYAGYDPERFTTFVHRGIAIDEERGEALSVQDARPENFTVQADIWCGDNHHAAETLTSQLKLQFHADDTPLLVRFGDAKYYRPPFDVPEHCKYMGDITCRLVDEGINDNSQGITGSVATAKDIRKTFSGTLYGWLPRVPFKVKLVSKLEYAIYDKTLTTPVVLQTATVNFVV